MIRPRPLLLLAALLLASAARANEWEGYPLSLIDRPFSLPRGMLEGTAGVGVNLSEGSAFQPVYPGLGLGYGISNDFTLRGDFGFCFNDSTACSSAANDARVLGIYTFDRGSRDTMAFTLGATLPAFSPRVELYIPLGVLFRYTPLPELFSIVVAPRFDIALTDRSTVQFDTFVAPFAFEWQATAHLTLQLQLAFDVPLDTPQADGTGPLLQGSLGFGAVCAVTNLFDIGASFTFVNLLGKGPTQGADDRELSIFLAYRM